MDQLPRLGKRELICLLLFTCNYVVSVWRGFLFLWVLGMGYVILLWHSLSLPLIIFMVFPFFLMVFFSDIMAFPSFLMVFFYSSCISFHASTYSFSVHSVLPDKRTPHKHVKFLTSTISGETHFTECNALVPRTVLRVTVFS